MNAGMIEMHSGLICVHPCSSVAILLPIFRATRSAENLVMKTRNREISLKDLASIAHRLVHCQT